MKNIMYRAIQYLKYKKIKSIMLIALFSIMSIVLLLSSSLDSTISNYYNSINNKNGIEVSVNPVMSRKTQQPSSNSDRRTATNVTAEQLAQIQELEYITDVKQNTNLSVTSDGVEAISYSEEETTSNSTNTTQSGSTALSNVIPDASKDSGSSERRNQMSNGLRIYGSTNYNLETIFSENTISLSSGEMPTTDNQIVISKTLADDNDLKLKDSITLKNSNDEDKTAKYTIVGIYTYNATLDEMSMQMIPENTMYTTYSAVTSMVSSDYTPMISTQYYVNSSDDFETFKEAYYKITNTTEETVQLSLNDEVYTSTIQPLSQIAEIMSKAKIVIIVGISALIAIILYLMIKERNYEIGVLYSLSERKRNIVTQFITENVILVSIAFIVGLAVSLAVGSNIISILLNMDVFSNIKDGATRMGGGRSMMPSSSATVATDITASWDILGISSVYLILVILVIIITLITVSKTLMKRPKEIIND
ncbi:ABC transporter permease [Mycoplasma sp. P36-A1]|uniref:ABC transporter permease n=1 Tax=Mycoplasma sp. P36-A1 TaxID=3252900 RepID=UPI003C2BAA36